MKVKKDCFEYSIDKLIEWYKEIHPSNPEGWKSDFTKLKLIKLNFFLSAVNADEESDGLLDVFDNYFAMPYGHVEKDVYKSIPSLSKYKITNTGIEIINNKYEFNSLSEDIRNRVDNAVASLRLDNDDFISYGAFKLVEISRDLYSWINMYNLANMRGEICIKIPIDLIKKEAKDFKVKRHTEF